MKLVPLLWSRRRVLALSAVAAVLVAVLFALLTPAKYTGSSTVLLLASEPAVTSSRGGESVLSLRLKDFADNDFTDAVTKAAGSEAKNLSSATAKEQKTDPIAYQVAVQANSGKAASAGVRTATKALVDRYTALAKEEVDRIERQVNEQMGPLTSQKSSFDGQAAQKKTELDSLQAQLAQIDGRISALRSAAAKDALSGSSASQSTADRLVAPLQAQRDALLPSVTAKRTELDQATARVSQIENERTTLLDALSGAKKTYLAGLAAANVSTPEAPHGNLLFRLIESAGLGLVLGLAFACISLVWLERRSLRGWLEPRLRSAVQEPEPAASPAPATEPAPARASEPARAPQPVPPQPAPPEPAMEPNGPLPTVPAAQRLERVPAAEPPRAPATDPGVLPPADEEPAAEEDPVPRFVRDAW